MTTPLMEKSNSGVLKGMKDIMWALVFAAAVIGVGRFVFGLGASTNMLDTLPWGFWKIFNMVAGAAVATSGFVVACIIYILRLDKFRPVARLSILIGFLGYGASLTALIFDIGLPHRGWHAFFMWNPHSFLFEVFWCVSCYWGITALELVPLITERFPWPKVTHFLHEIMLPFVVLGITLSTMHHSSLGSLFLASPTRLHPLWHSMWIPPEFFISAMGAGLATIAFMMILCSWLYRQKRNMPVITGLAKGSAFFLLLYLVIKVADFTVNHKWNYVFGPDLTWESRLFWAEIGLQAIIPVVLIAIPAVRKSVTGLVLATLSAITGLLLHRIDTGIVGYFRSSEAAYIPNLSEFILGFGVLSGAGLLFFFLVERFYIFSEPGHGKADGPALWTRKEGLSLLFSPSTVRVLLIGAVVVPVTLFGLQDQATGHFRPVLQPVTASIGLDPLRTNLRIDGDRDGESVLFTHEQHKELLGGEDSCLECHHLSLPKDETTACWQCHRDMEVETELFDHEAHQARQGGKDSCGKCHTEDLPESKETAKACMDCHRENMRNLESYKIRGYLHKAMGYKQAMHGLCLTCHRQKEKDPTDPLDMSNCQCCHPVDEIDRVN